MQRLHLLFILGVGLTIFGFGTALAGPYDLNLARLSSIATSSGKLLDGGGGYDVNVHGTILKVYPHNSAFRSIMSELGVVFAPNILAPADTSGYIGYGFSLEFGFVKINPQNKSKSFTISEQGDGSGLSQFDGITVPELPYWRAAQAVGPLAFNQGNISSTDGTSAGAYQRMMSELPSTFAPTISLMARKGLWLPIPSIELGLGVKHLIGSRMWAPTASAKFSLTEGFQGWPLPAFAIRGSVSRLLGTPAFNMTVVGLDFSLSHHFGIASTFNLTPYIGYQLLWIVADSEVLDATPGVDAMDETAKLNPNDPQKLNRCQHSDCRGYFSFASQSDILRNRFFLGARLNFYLVSLLFDYSVFFSGSTADDLAAALNPSGHLSGDLKPEDVSETQHAFSLSLELDF